jgi:hypothetical protein
MRLNIVVLLLVAGVMSWIPQEAGARAVKGDKTLELGSNFVSWSKHSDQTCDGAGNNCKTTANTTILNVGAGLSGGYLLTDLLEIGIGIGFSRYSSDNKPVPASPDDNYEFSTWGLDGNGYMKLHFGSDATLVPFAAGGLGLGMNWTTDDFSNVKTRSSSGMLELFAEGGVDWYIGEKYAITGSLGITGTGGAYDFNTKSESDNIRTIRGWTIGFGLGISTYF